MAGSRSLNHKDYFKSSPYQQGTFTTRDTVFVLTQGLLYLLSFTCGEFPSSAFRCCFVILKTIEIEEAVQRCDGS